MKAAITATATLQNPPGKCIIEGIAEYKDPAELPGAIMRMIGSINALGGILQKGGAGEWDAQFIPMCRIVDIYVSVSQVMLADLSEVPSVTARTRTDGPFIVRQ